jgi:DNA polymerase III delta subunit
MSFQTFLKEVHKGMPLPIYLLYTEDAFFQREAVEAIKGLVPASERDFNFHTFDLLIKGEEAPALMQVLDVVKTASFFGGRRFTVVAGNMQKLVKKDRERLNAYVSGPAEGSVLVLIHGGPLTKDTREKFGALKPMSLDIKESEIPYWIKQRAAMKEVEASADAIDYLLDLIGPDFGLLSAEVDKISLLGKKRINADDISGIVAGGRLYSIFDLVNALRKGDPQRVLHIYKSLKDTVDDYSLIGALNWQYGRNLNPRNSPSENEYLLRVFELLNKADIDIKSSGRTFPMEYLLVKLLRLQAGPS